MPMAETTTPAPAGTIVVAPAATQSGSVGRGDDPAPATRASAATATKGQAAKHLRKRVEKLATRKDEEAALPEPPNEEPPPITWATVGDFRKRIVALEVACPQHACVSASAKNRDNYGALPIGELSKWQAMVEACWRQCGLPMK